MKAIMWKIEESASVVLFLISGNTLDFAYNEKNDAKENVGYKWVLVVTTF